MSEDVRLVSYRPELRAEFERLNRIWLEGHALLEPLDLEYLQNPETRILAGGGAIFFAIRGEQAVGTVAAIRVSGDSFELAKLSVDPSAKGGGIGRRLCQAVIDYARAAGAGRIELTSASRLKTAIALYESMGFMHAPMPEKRYETADVYMVKNLSGAE